MKTSSSRPAFLDIAAYVTLISIGFTGILIIDTILWRWLALGILILIGILVYALLHLPVDAPTQQANSYLLILTALEVLLLWLQPRSYIFSLLGLILSAAAMLILPRRNGTVWVILFMLISGFMFIASANWFDGLRAWLPFVGGFLFVAILSSALQRADRAQRESNRLLAELGLAHHQLQEYALQVETLAVVEERNRMARELHDTLGHRLTVAAVQLEGAQRLIPSDPERAARLAGTVREQVREALNELRRSVGRLREPVEAELPFAQSLRQLAGSFSEATNLKVHLVLPDEIPDLPIEARAALYRAAQEGLTNIQRHARASQAWVELVQEACQVTLRVADDGAGLGPGEHQPGFGILGLQERAARLNGQLRLEERLGGGICLVFSIPIIQEQNHA